MFGNRTRAAGLATGVLLALAVAVVHGVFTLLAFPLGRDSTLPYVNHDHTFHFYYGWLAARANGPNFACYDPYFMAGYPKSLWFPTSSTYPELVGWLSGGSGLAYRLYVVSATWLSPLLLSGATFLLTGSLWRTLLAAILAILWFWTAFPVTYVTWGMVAFILTTSLAVLGAASIMAWLDRPSGRAAFPFWILGVAVLTIAQIGHPSTAVTSGCLLLPAFLGQRRRTGWKHALLFWLIPVVVLLFWSPWLLPALALRETCRTLATGFINYNLIGRMVELATARFPTESAMLVIGGVTLAVCGSTNCPAARRGLAWGAALLFFLGYVGAAVPFLAFLQPGRYTQPFYATLVVATAALAPDSSCGMVRRFVLGSAWAIGGALVAFSLYSQAPLLAQPRLATRLPQPLERLAERVRSFSPDTGRLLFEEVERREEPLRFGLSDPTFGVTAGALLPPLTGHQVIGGPYLYTHLTTNNVQFGDGKLLGTPVEELTPRTFARIVDLYNVALIAAWSPPVLAVLESDRDRYDLIDTFGHIRLYQVRHPSGWALKGKARVRSEPNRLVLRDVVPATDGLLVLKYHWAPGLHCDHGTILPLTVQGDPVPFVAIRDIRGTELEIRWRVPSLNQIRRNPGRE